MLEVNFSKLHGTSNSFIIVSDLAGIVNKCLKAHPQKIIALTSTERGLGADGLVLIQDSAQADFKIIIYNAKDASIPEMCGNAVRCISKFLYDQKYHMEAVCRLETGAGIIETEMISHTPLTASVRVKMGPPYLRSKAFPQSLAKSAHILNTFDFNGRTGHFISMGNPHAVIAVSDYEFDYLTVAYTLQQNKTLFPNGVNVGFLHQKNKTMPLQGELRVVERGVGETLACGTGACAAAAVMMLTASSSMKDLHTAHKQSRNSAQDPQHVAIQMPGGKLSITWDRTQTKQDAPLTSEPPPFPSMLLTATAEHIATGTFYL